MISIDISSSRQIFFVTKDTLDTIGAQVTAEAFVVSTISQNVQSDAALTLIVWELRVLFVEEQLQLMRRQLEK